MATKIKAEMPAIGTTQAVDLDVNYEALVIKEHPVFEQFVHFSAGTFSGAAGVLAGHPLDTVKVRLQTQHTGNTQYRGTFHCFTTIVRKEGFGGLYKGLSAPLASLTVINAAVFGVHGGVSKEFADPNSLQAHFLGGCAAGMAQSVIAAPSERLKLKMQIQYDSAHTMYKSPMHAAGTMIRENGLGSLNRGFLVTLLRDTPAFGLYFVAYEYLARSMSRDGKMESLTGPQLLLAGGGAGMVSWLFNYPADVIKTRFQADDSYRGYWDCIKKTYAERGWRTFYVGLGSTLLRAFPSNAATFFTVEWTYRLLLDFNVLGVGTKAELHKHSRHINMNDFWNKNSFLLPEAGSTSIDPMIHGCRFLWASNNNSNSNSNSNSNNSGKSGEKLFSERETDRHSNTEDIQTH